MRKLVNSILTPSVRKWMRSEVVVTPLAFAAVMFVYISGSSGFFA